MLQLSLGELITGAGLEKVMLQFLLRLVELLEGHLRLLPRLPQLRVPTGQALLQLGLGQFVGALLSGPEPPQILQIADAILQLPLLLRIGHGVTLSFFLQLLVELQQGRFRCLPSLPQFRLPTGKALLQLG